MSVDKRTKKRHRRRDDDDDDSSNSISNRKRKKSDHKKHKKSKKHKKDRKVRPTGATDYGPPTDSVPARLLDPSKDYFLYNKQLCLYLETKGLVFDQLSGSDARKAFGDFCKLYNKGRLASVFYDDGATSSSRTTNHTWSFQTSVIENERLREVQRSVAEGGSHQPQLAGPKSHPTRTMPPPPRKQQEDSTPSHKKHMSSRRRHDYESIAEEYGLTSTKDMPAAQVRRREAAARTHNNDATVATELSDDALYGGDQRASFAAAVAAQKQRQEKRAAHQQARVATLQEEERKRQQNMLEVLGLAGKVKAGEKIQIAPRND